MNLKIIYNPAYNPEPTNRSKTVCQFRIFWIRYFFWNHPIKSQFL